MKQRSTTPVSKQSFVAKAAAVACAVLIAISAPIQLGHTVFADDYEAQIQAAQNEAAQNQSQADQLHQMATSLQAELAQLDAQKRAIQTQIDATQGKIDGYQRDIENNNVKIDQNKGALSDTITDMYVDSDTTTLMMVASSKNIADFVDKQAQQSTIQNKLNETIDKINALQEQIKTQKQAVERENKNQKAQRTQLADAEAQKQKVLTETQGQESAYQAQAQANNTKVAQLRQAQKEANERAMAALAAQNRQNSGGTFSVPIGDPSGGGYPYTAGPLDYGVDPWGLYYRECVSYTAWKVASTGRFVPHFGGRGNANQWPSTVAQYGIQSGSAPRAGSVAMWPIGYYGHVMYVESVNGDGTITVSDYNLGWDGLYRKYTRPASGLTYIYF